MTLRTIRGGRGKLQVMLRSDIMSRMKLPTGAVSQPQLALFTNFLGVNNGTQTWPPPALLCPTSILYTSLPFTLLHSHPFLPHARWLPGKLSSVSQTLDHYLRQMDWINNSSATNSASYIVFHDWFFSVVIVHFICTLHSCATYICVSVELRVKCRDR